MQDFFHQQYQSKRGKQNKPYKTIQNQITSPSSSRGAVPSNLATLRDWWKIELTPCNGTLFLAPQLYTPSKHLTASGCHEILKLFSFELNSFGEDILPPFITYTIHGTGLFTYINGVFLWYMSHVGKYTSPMDPMGNRKREWTVNIPPPSKQSVCVCVCVCVCCFLKHQV